MGAEGFFSVPFTVSQEAVKTEMHVNAGEPTLTDFSGGMSSGRVDFLLNAPLTSNFPDEVDRLRDDDGVQMVGTGKWAASRVMKVTYRTT